MADARSEPSSSTAPDADPLRVGWVVSAKAVNLLGRMLGPLAAGLLDELIQIVAVCPRNGYASELPSPPIEYLPHGRLRWGFVPTGAVEQLGEELRSRKVGLVHAMDASGAWAARRLAAFTGQRYVLTCHALGDGRRLGLMHRHAEAVLATSEPVKEELLKYHVAPPERIRLLRPGVYQVQHAGLLGQPDRSAAIVAGNSGRKVSALLAVIEAFARLRKRRYDCQLFLIGSDRKDKALRKRVERLDLRHDVTFMDPFPGHRLPGIFKAADVYVSAGRTHELDVRSLLAMAAGVPVLGAAGSVGDFLRDDRTVIEFTEGDDRQIAAKLSKLLDDPTWANGLAAAALAHLRRNNTPAQMVSLLTNLYRGLPLPREAAGAPPTEGQAP